MEILPKNLVLPDATVASPRDTAIAAMAAAAQILEAALPGGCGGPSAVGNQTAIAPDAATTPDSLVNPSLHSKRIPESTTMGSLRIGLVSAGAMAICSTMIAGCGANSNGSSGSSTSNVGRLYFEPNPAEVGELITISGSAANPHPDNSSATYVAVRDGSVTVATGVVTWPSDGSLAPLSFTDSLILPGLHSYVVTLSAPDAGSSSLSLDLPVAYNLAPSIAASAFTESDVTLTLTLTNNGSGTVAFVVPYSITTESPTSPTIENFDFASQPLAPGASRSRSATYPLPLSATVTYILTVDPLADHGTNLAGSPATAQIIIPSGGG